MSDIENEKPKRSKKSRKGAGQEQAPVESEVSRQITPASAIEWNDATSSLDFKEQNELPETSEQEDTLARFEELARRVAETVSKNRSDDDEVIAAADVSTVEQTEGTSELGATDIHALEVEDTEILDTEIETAGLSELTDTMNELAADAGLEPVQMSEMNLDTFESELSQAENDADPEPVEFIEHDRLMSIIESLLFSTDKPVSTATIKQVFKGSNVRSKDITRAIDLLASEYASSQRGVTLEEINGGYQLRTKADNTEYLRRLAKVRPFRLSGPALEVMAIVAYKQPCTKHEIDEIRGVESGHLLRALMERGLVSFGDKSELPGKPMTYQSTRKFLETFGLRNIRELPSLGEIDELLPEGIGEVEEEKETLSDLTEQMSTSIGSTYSESEDELSKINDQLKAVDTTSEFFEQEKVRERERRDRERAQDIREKLVLGDAVESKDQRWLDRYEAKLLAPPESSLAGQAARLTDGTLTENGDSTLLVESDLLANDQPGIGSELEALTEESTSEQLKKAGNDEEDSLSASDDELAADEKLDAELNDEMNDELAGNLDWDEDSEKEV